MRSVHKLAVVARAYAKRRNDRGRRVQCDQQKPWRSFKMKTKTYYNIVIIYDITVIIRIINKNNNK